MAFAADESRELQPNALVLRIQPDEGVALRFGAKVPGQAFHVRDVLMDMSYGSAFMEEAPEAYERLLLDAMAGDPTLFIRTDEVDQAWQIVDPILEAWQNRSVPLAGYAAGTWGPRRGRAAHRPGRAVLADSVAVDDWSAEGVHLSDVINALSVLRDQSSERNSARTAVMTLIAVAPGDEQAYRATNALRALGGHHPAE